MVPGGAGRVRPHEQRRAVRPDAALPNVCRLVRGGPRPGCVPHPDRQDWRAAAPALRLDDEVKRLTVPVLLVYGDADSIPPSHAAEFYALLGGGLRDAGLDGSLPTASRLAILPGISHYNIFSVPQLAAVVAEFLR
jgi:pimeloyl-ACP methyl ester carboxylesterase